MFEDVICLIPARKGSKGIPGKNMKTINDVPLFVYSVKSAIQAGLPPSNIVVSSDDDDILRLAKLWGVFAHRRPDEISGDNSPTEAAMLDAINNAKPNQEFKCMLLLQPTSPIRFNGRLKHALHTYSNGDYDSLLSTTKHYPFFWMERHDKCVDKWSWVSSSPSYDRPMRQNIEREDYHYFDNGNFYITDISLLKNTKYRLGSKVCVYTVTELEGMQIDDPLDFDIMKKIIDCAGAWSYRYCPPDLQDFKEKL